MLLSNRNFLFLLFVFLMPIEVWSAVPTKDIEVRIEGNVAVSGQRVVLGDVATIYAKSMRDFRGLSDLEISQISDDKGEITIPLSYLQHRIEEALPPGTVFALHAPELIVFKLQKLGVSPIDFAAEVERQAKAGSKVPAGVETEIELISGADQLKLLQPDSLKIEPAAEMNQWRGEIAFKVTPKNGGAITWVKARVRWFANVWVAQKQQSFSQALDAAAFTQERREITALREEAFAAESLEDLSAKFSSARARRTIAPSSILTAAMIERRPDATPGQALKVVFISENGIRVTTDGALIGSGTIGSEAKAKLKTSRKVVSGRLVSGGTMEVSL